MRIIILFAIVILFGGFSFDEDVTAIVQSKARLFFLTYQRTKLELYFNQPRYSPGDTAYVKMVYLMANNYKPVRGKQVVHLSLYDQSGANVLTQWATITNGTSDYQLVIPSNLSPGNYLMVAFTDWMKNFDKSLFFRQQFQIAGKYSMIKAYPKDTLSFYPEGGSLAANVENTIAIWYEGKDIKATAVIREEGNIIATVTLKRDSVSTFTMVPKVSGIYVAELIEKGRNKIFHLPAISKSGLSIVLTSVEDKLTLTSRVANETQFPEDVYLGVFNGNGMVYKTPLRFATQNLTTELPANLPSGILQLVLFDSKFNLLASRVIHHGKAIPRTVTISNLQEYYTTRQKVKANVQIAEESGYLLSGNFTCRVISDDLLAGNESQPMDYLTFRSDISNTIEFSERSSSAMTTNNYLITQTCPWFDWNKIIKGNPTTSFRPQEYLYLSGKATFAKNGKPVNDSTLLMFFLENGLQEYEAYAKGNGEFSLLLYLMVDPKDRFFYTASFKGNDVEDIIVKMHPPDSSLTFSAEPWDFVSNSTDQYAAYSAKKNTVVNSFSFFVDQKTQRDSTEDKNKLMEDELNGADIKVNLKDFLQMPSMGEVVRELIKSVEYRKINGRDVIRVYTTLRMPGNKTGPVYFIDGQVTKDPSYFLSLKPADLIYVRVVNDSRKLGALGRLGDNGVILIKTKNQSVVVRDNHVIDFAGFLPASKLIAAIKTNAQLPDFRSCLFWSPKIALKGAINQEINFFTSDDVGKYKLQVHGVGEDGTPFYTEQPFTVKFSKNQ